MEQYITELANDIAKSCPDLVENGCGNDNCVACLAFKLIGLGYKKQTETADVAPKSEVEKRKGRCREWHEVAELKSNCIMELDEGLAKANAEIKRLHGILLQFTDIVHKWGARNGIDTSEISLVPILQKEADGIVGKMEQEIETLKDNNEHLAVMLTEAKSDVARKIFDDAIRAVYSKIDMKIYNTIDGKPLSDHVAYGKQMAMYDVITLLAELKNKYTEEKE